MTIFNKISRDLKKSSLMLIFSMFFITTTSALTFVTEENAVNTDNFVINADDAATDYVDLDFGETLTARFRYDIALDKFNINKNVDLENNELLNLRIENLASAPTCDSSSLGRMYFNTTDKLTYTCDGVSTWNPLENALNATIEFPVVQARRTTSYTLTTSYADIDLDTTDLENDPTTLDHDNTNRDRIDIGATAMYQIIYGYTAGGSATSTHEARARVRVNDATVLPGSESVNKNYQGEFSTTSASFLANLSAGDFITLQLQRDSTADATQDEIFFSIVKLEGIKGEKGDTGPAGADGVDGTNSGITNSETFTIDNDNTGGDLALVFGQNLNERLTWNNAQSRFDLSDALNVFEDLTVGSDTETIDNASFVMNGNDVFIADSLGVEGAIYTDDTATKYQFIDIYGCVRGSAAAGTIAGGRSSVIRFDSGGNSQMRCSFPVPDDWVPGTDIKIETYWSPSDNTSGDIDFDLEYASFGIGDTVSSGSFSDIIPGTTYETVNSNTQSNIYEMTGNLPSAGINSNDMMNIRLRRTPGDAGDTYAGDVNIHMLRISYTGKKLH